MKNYIPLVLAVLLGLAAVLAVARLVNKSKIKPEDTAAVVAATRKITEGEELHADAVMKKNIPLSARPADAIPWSKVALIEGQKAKKTVAQSDYVLLSDIGLNRGMGNMVSEGEWAVTFLANGGIVRLVQPGDEIAIIGTFNVETTVKSADLSAPGQKAAKEVTMVLFPRVRVLDNGGGSGELVVGLPPQQAQVLIAAQGKARLTLALRKPGDASAIDRINTGMVDTETFSGLMTDVKSIVLPATPGSTEKIAPAK
jgi:Flp pilus assembly protein CpaB